jgi:putative flippase GtrA
MADSDPLDGTVRMNNAKRITNTLTAVNEKRPRLRRFIGKVSIKYGGHRHKELERFIKFAFVGLVGTVVDLGTTNFLMKTVFHVTKDDPGVPVLIASTIGFILAVVNNFIWNRYWTYPDSRSHPIMTQLGQFFLVNLGGLIIRVLIVILLSPQLSLLIGSLPHTLLQSLSITKDVQAIIGGETAILSSIVVVMLWNFFVNRYWTYNDVK